MWVANLWPTLICTHSYWSYWDSPSWGNRPAFCYKDLVGDIENALASNTCRQHACRSEGIMHIEWTEIVQSPDGMLTFVSIGIMSVQWWLAFRRRPGLVVFIPTTLRVFLNSSAHLDVHVWAAEKWPGLDLTCLTACYDHVNVCISTKWLWGICLHCSEMGMIYMRHWKQEAWVWILAMWLQVEMSVSRSMYASSQCLTSGGLINSDCVSAPFLFCWTCMPCSQGIWIKPPDICCWGSWMAWHKPVCCLDQEWFLIISAIVHRDYTNLWWPA